MQELEHRMETACYIGDIVIEDFFQLSLLFIIGDIRHSENDKIFRIDRDVLTSHTQLKRLRVFFGEYDALSVDIFLF